MSVPYYIREICSTVYRNGFFDVNSFEDIIADGFLLPNNLRQIPIGSMRLTWYQVNDIID